MGPICEERRLERMAEYHQERKRLRSLANGSILWGIINLALGVSSLPENLVNLIPVGIGSLLLVEGIWLRVQPSALGFLVDGVVLLLIGLWDLFLFAVNVLLGLPPSFVWLSLGLLFTGIALYRMLSFPRIHQLFQEEFSADELQQMDSLLRYVNKSTLRQSDDLILLQMGPHQWRVYLGSHYALFVRMGRQKVLAAQRANVFIEECGKVLFSSHLKVRVAIGDQTWQGSMPPGAFAKFQAWKLGDQVAAAPEMPPSPPSDAYARRDQTQ